MSMQELRNPITAVGLLIQKSTFSCCAVYSECPILGPRDGVVVGSNSVEKSSAFPPDMLVFRKLSLMACGFWTVMWSQASKIDLCACYHTAYSAVA